MRKKLHGVLEKIDRVCRTRTQVNTSAAFHKSRRGTRREPLVAARIVRVKPERMTKVTGHINIALGLAQVTIPLSNCDGDTEMP